MGRKPIDRDVMESVQLDTLSVRARKLVPAIVDARDRMPENAEPWLDALAEWEYRMDRDSRAALVFAQCLSEFRRLTWSPFFEAHDLGRQYWPDDWVLLNLPPDSEVFDGDREAILVDAIDRAIDEIDANGWETYGDVNVIAIDHPLGDLEPGLNYERYPTDGAWQTVRSVSASGNWGSVYRLLTDFDGDSVSVLPGGNDGTPTGEHYQDQLQLWADGKYKQLRESAPDGEDIIFEGADR